jgi:hypothetical protein
MFTIREQKRNDFGGQLRTVLFNIIEPATGVTTSATSVYPITQEPCSMPCSVVNAAGDAEPFDVMPEGVIMTCQRSARNNYTEGSLLVRHAGPKHKFETQTMCTRLSDAVGLPPGLELVYDRCFTVVAKTRCIFTTFSCTRQCRRQQMK